MADIRPFPGLRPRPELIEQVASPPYDVMNTDEARRMTEGNPHSFLHVVRAEVDLPKDTDPHSEAVYQKSADNLTGMIDEGTLIRDDRPCFYLYQLTMDGHVQHGLVLGASVDEYEQDKIKKHELTRREKEDDRAKHVEKLMANAGPVLLTYHAQAEVSTMVKAVCGGQKPVYDFVADDGVGHRLWVIDDDEKVRSLREAFGRVDSLYIADGHHRSASAFRVRNLLKDANPNHNGEEPYNHFLAVAFPDDELKIMGYNRVVKDLNGLAPGAFLEKVRVSFEVCETQTAEPDSSHQFGMHLDGIWYRLTPRDGVADRSDDPVRSLDVSILQDNLLAPILGVGDPRTDKRIDFVGGIRGTGELEKRCQKDMRVGFALYPVSVEQLIAISDEHAIMPPKSTWFEPKLRSGVVVRSLRNDG